MCKEASFCIHGLTLHLGYSLNTIDNTVTTGDCFCGCVAIGPQQPPNSHHSIRTTQLPPLNTYYTAPTTQYVLHSSHHSIRTTQLPPLNTYYTAPTTQYVLHSSHHSIRTTQLPPLNTYYTAPTTQYVLYSSISFHCQWSQRIIILIIRIMCVISTAIIIY